MKKTFFVILLLISTMFIINPNVSAEETYFEMEILENDGLTQYSDTNYTFDCEEAGTNMLTIIMRGEGFKFIEITKLDNEDNIWVGEGFQQIDREGDVYCYQFLDDARYRLKFFQEINNETNFRYYYINVIGGEGSFYSGDVELLIEKGEWVDLMIIEFGRDWPGFQQWSHNAYRFYTNPAYVITDFLKEVPIFLMMPHVWLIIMIVVAIVIWRYRRRIKVTQSDRQLAKKHGTREDLIREKRKAIEEKRLRSMTTMPLDYALQKYGDGDWLPRAVCYHEGVPELGVTYPTAYSLALDLGANLFSNVPEKKRRAQEIFDELVDKHSSVLEKAWVYKDISACARAVSAESVDVKSTPILKDKFMIIADRAEEMAKVETAELSKKLHVKSKEERPLSDIVSKTSKKLEKESEKRGLKEANKFGKKSDTS